MPWGVGGDFDFFPLFLTQGYVWFPFNFLRSNHQAKAAGVNKRQAIEGKWTSHCCDGCLISLGGERRERGV